VKILFVTTLADVGGVEINLLGLTAALSKRGHEIWIASASGPLVRDFEQRGAKHLGVELNLRNPFAIVGSGRKLRTLVRDKGIDIAHAMSAGANLALQFAPRGGSAVMVVSPMGLQNSESEPSLVTLLRNRLTVLRADRVLVISEEIRRALLDAGVSEERMEDARVIGIDLDAFSVEPGAGSRVRDEYGIAPEAPVVTTIGALHPRKSHELLLAAAAVLLKEYPTARFLLVGDGPERANLESLARRLRVDTSVIFCGIRRDIAAVLAATTVYVKPGVLEGFIGITVLEAMAAGVPVVAFETHDVRAVIENERTGLLATNRDSDQLAKSIAALLKSEELRDRLAEAARTQVAQRFSLEAVAADLEARYDRIRQAPAPSRSSTE
jgi:glycosyltransferase involved in cell wall biosynthesis